MPGKRCIPSQRQITLAQRTVGSPQAPHGRFQRFDFFGGFFEPLQVAQKQALIGTKPRPSRYEVMVKSAFTSSSLLADFLRKGRMRGLTRYSKRAEARPLRGPHLSLELASAFTASFRSSARLCEHLRASASICELLAGGPSTLSPRLGLPVGRLTAPGRREEAKRWQLRLQ